MTNEDLQELCDELEMYVATLLRLVRGDESACFERPLGGAAPADCTCHAYYASMAAATAKKIEDEVTARRTRGHGLGCGCGCERNLLAVLRRSLGLD